MYKQNSRVGLIIVRREKQTSMAILFCVLAIFGFYLFISTSSVIRLNNLNTIPSIHARPVAATVPGSSDPTGDEWPMFRGALNHTGVVATTPVQGTVPTWTYATNNETSCPVVAGGRLYVGTNYTTPSYGLSCFDAITGSKIWASPTGKIGSSPAVAGGRVYVIVGQRITCLNATTGAFNWSFTTGAGVESSPAVAGGRVYVGSGDGKMYCLNATTGAFIWSYTTSNWIESSPAIAIGRVYVGSDDHNVYCLNATTGAFIWSYTTNGYVVSSPAVAGGRVYIGSGDHDVYCLNATTGARAWNFTTGNGVQSSPAIGGGRVFVGSSDGKVYCLDATTGSSAWSYTTGMSMYSSPALASGRVFVGGNPNIYCLNATTGARMWNFTANGNVYFSPAIAGGCVYAKTLNMMYCLPMILLPSATVPSAPQSFTTTAGNNQVALNWATPASNGGSAITGYRIYRGTTPGGEMLLATVGVVLTYTAYNLTNGQVYYFKVAAVNAVGAGINSTEVIATPATSALSISSFVYITGNGTYVAGMYFVIRVNFVNPGGMGVNSIRAALTFGGYTGLTPNASNSIMVGAGGTGNIDFLIMTSSSATSSVVTINATWSGTEQTTGTPVNGGPSPLNVTIKAQAALAITNFTVITGNGTYVAGTSFVARVALSNPVTSAKAWVTASLTFGGATGVVDDRHWSESATISGTGYIDFLLTIASGASSQSIVTITTIVNGTEEISGRALGPITSNLVIAIKAQAALAFTSAPTCQTGNGTYVAGTMFVVRLPLSNNPATNARAKFVNATLSGLVSGVTANYSVCEMILGTRYLDILITIGTGVATQTLSITASALGTEEITSRGLSAGPSAALSVTIKAQASLAITGAPTYLGFNSTYVAGTTFVLRVPLRNNPATNARALGVTASLSGLVAGVTANASASKTILVTGYIDFWITIGTCVATQALSITASVTGTEEISSRALSAGPSAALSVTIKAQAALAIAGAPMYQTGNGTYVAGLTFTLRVPLTNNPATNARALGVTATLSGLVAGVTANSSASRTILGTEYIDFLITIGTGVATQVLLITASVTGTEEISSRALSAGPSTALSVTIKAQASLIITSFTALDGNGTYVAGQTLRVRVGLTNPATSARALSVTAPLTFGGATSISSNSSVSRTISGTGYIDALIMLNVNAPSQPMVTITATVTGMEEISVRALGPITSNLVIAIKAQAALTIEGTPMYQTGNGTFVAGMTFVMRVQLSNNPAVNARALSVWASLSGLVSGITANSSVSKTILGMQYIDFLITIAAGVTTQMLSITASATGTEEISSRALSTGPSNAITILIVAQASLTITNITCRTGNGTYVAGQSLIVRIALNSPVTSAKVFFVSTILTYGGYTGISTNASASITVRGTAFIDLLVIIQPSAMTATVSISAWATGNECYSGRQVNAVSGSPLVVNIKSQATIIVDVVNLNATAIAPGRWLLATVNVRNVGGIAVYLGNVSLIFSGNGSSCVQHPGTVVNWTLNSLYLPANTLIGAQVLFFISSSAINQSIIWVNASFTGTELISSRSISVPQSNTPAMVTVLQGPGIIFSASIVGGRTSYIRMPSSFDSFIIRAIIDNSEGTTDITGGAVSLNTIIGFTVNTTYSSLIVTMGTIQICDFLVTITNSAGLGVSNFQATLVGNNPNPFIKNSTSMSIMVCRPSSVVLTAFTYVTGNSTYVAGQTFTLRLTFTNLGAGVACLGASATLNFNGASGLSANCSTTITISANGTTSIDFLVSIAASAVSQPTVWISAGWTGTEQYTNRALGGSSGTNVVITIKAQAALTITSFTYLVYNGTYLTGTSYLVLRVTLNTPFTSASAVTVTAPLTFNGAIGISANSSASRTFSGTSSIDFLITIAAGAPSQPTVMITTTVSGFEEISGRSLGPITSNLMIAIKAQAALAISTPMCQTGNSTYVAGTTFVVRVPLTNNPATNAKALYTTVSLSGLAGGIMANSSASKTILGNSYIDILITIPAGTASETLSITASASGSEEITYQPLNAGPSAALSVTIKAQAALVITGAPTYQTANGTYIAGKMFVVRVSLSNSPVTNARALFVTATLNGLVAGVTANASASKTILGTGYLDFLITIGTAVATQALSITASVTGTEEISSRALSAGPSAPLSVTIKAQAALAIAGAPTYQTGYDGTYVAGMTFILRVSLTNNPATNARALGVTSTLGGLVAGVTANASASKTILGTAYIDFLITIGTGVATQVLSITASVTGTEEISSRALSAGPSAALNIDIKAQAVLSITSITYLSDNGTYVAGTTFVVRVTLSNPATSAKAILATAPLTFGGAAGISSNASSARTINGTKTIDFLITLTAGAPTNNTVTIKTTASSSEEYSARSLGPITSNLVIAIKAQAALAITSITYRAGNGTYVAGQAFIVRVALNNPATSARAVAVTAPLTFGGATGISANSSASKTISGVTVIDILLTIAPSMASQPMVTITATVTGTEEISVRALGPITSNLVIAIKAQAALAITGSPIDQTGNGTYVAGTTFVVRVSLSNPATSAKAKVVTASLNCIGASGLSTNMSAAKTISGAGSIDILITIAPGAPSQEATIIATVSGIEEITMRALSAGPSNVLNVNVIMNSNYTIPPTTSISYTPIYTIGSKHWVNTATTFTLISSGGSGFQTTYYKWNGSGNHAWTRYTTPFNLAGVGNGTYTISWCSWDNANNNETLKSQVVYIDTFSPTTGIAYTASRAPNYVNATTMFSLTTSDNTGGSGVAFTQYQYTGSGGWQTYSSPFTLSSALNGTVVINYRSTDNAGNVESFGATTVQYEHCTVPGAPTGLTAVIVETTLGPCVALYWVAPASNGGSAITHYWIYCGTMSGGERLETQIGNMTYWGLLGCGGLYYMVAAGNDIGLGPNSTEAIATPAQVPSAPRSLTATAGNMQVLLSWLPPIDNGNPPIQTYSIYRWNASGIVSVITIPSNETSYNDSGLTNGETYYYKIMAENWLGMNANSTIVNATPSIMPPNRYPVLVLVFALHRQAFYNPIHVAINITYGDWPVQQAWCIVDNSTVHILALSNGTATWGIYTVDVNLTAGWHSLAFFVQDTGNHTISKFVMITVLLITTTSNNSTIIVIIIVAIILGMSVGVAVPLSYSRYKQKLDQKKQLGSQASPKAKQLSSTEDTSHSKADKRARLLKASMPVNATAQPYLGVKVVQRCTLHKGLIVGPIYSCKACGAMYCIDCINQLRETGENCWNCGGSIEPKYIEDGRQQGSVKQNLDSFQFSNIELTMFSTAVWEKLGDMEKNRAIEPEIFEELIAKLKQIPPEDRLKYLDSEKFQVKQPHLDDEDE